MSHVKESETVTNDSESGYTDEVQHTAQYGSALLTRPSNQEPMTKQIKLLKTICMLLIYLGMVKIYIDLINCTSVYIHMVTYSAAVI